MIPMEKIRLSHFKFIANYLVLILLIQINAISAQAQMDMSALVEQVTPSVVLINVYNNKDEQIGIGSGFFIEKEGVLVTNYHVIENGVKVSARLSTGEFVPIKKILAEDKEGDLVLLSIDVMGRSFPALKLTKTGFKTGQPVVVIGSPFGLVGTVSNGIISAIRDIPNFGKILQISAPISIGSSGSPVFNMKGEVIGVASATIIGGQSLNFAIPADRVSKMLKNYQEEERALKKVIEEIRKAMVLEEIQKKVARDEKAKEKPAGGSPSAPTTSSPKIVSLPQNPPSIAELNEYYNMIWAKIKEAWTIPENLFGGMVNLETVIVIIIERDGKIQECWFEKKSGDDLYDQMAMRAIKKAEPLPPIPREFNEKTIEIGIRFFLH